MEIKKASIGITIMDVIIPIAKSCLCTFWHCHLYSILQFYSIVPLYLLLWYDGNIPHICYSNLAKCKFAHVCLINAQRS